VVKSAAEELRVSATKRIGKKAGRLMHSRRQIVRQVAACALRNCRANKDRKALPAAKLALVEWLDSRQEKAGCGWMNCATR
jgi:hypothetical protein